MALQTATDFFKNLPPKQCTNCGNEIDEMHDCYTHQCEKCDSEVK